MSVEVSALFVYPVKSLGGIALDEARLGTMGLANDRRWMLVRGDGRFVSQREIPGLSRVRCALRDGELVLARDGLPPLVLDSGRANGHRVPVSVWKDHWEALDAGDNAAEWVSRAAGGDHLLRLVRLAEDRPRPQGQPERYGATVTTGFADGAPYLLAGDDSLARLNQVLLETGRDAVPMNRFRPNIVVSGLGAFREHALAALHGPGYSLEPRFPCERCVVTTINQATGVPDPLREPFRTLVSLNPMPGKPRSPAFAENAILARGDGATIRVGDRLETVPRPG